ncbi:class I SAM-dependent methyltransferase [Aurantimonas sp. MSK8Z-1]|uniref:class I SAM-dependent methyltransferase n=1 Tax=Mangrovibrevibacter kandeliae TaxID=2968473 RepID=UPI002117F07E|nr:class I SAM-dependent methyltransferase [Aurantimonas sp. MSK8Z-1]MCW4113891.1 class I SAM-dependent methyltransferase [Aurantimonas sp. MSK8Z-1]
MNTQFAFDGESLITPEQIAAQTETAKQRPAGAAIGEGEAELMLVLQRAQQRFENGAAPAGVLHDVFLQLNRLRRTLPADVWRDLVPLAQAHPVATFIHEDPFTRWSFEKPRGYSGDAGLLDFIYGHETAAPAIAETSANGRTLYDYTSSAPAAAAVRERRELLARHVDSIASSRETPIEVLTIAAGHLREAELSQALAKGRIERWVALDQDPHSVGTMTRDHAGTVIDPMNGSVKGLLTDAYPLGTFDFVYAAGLYDYLPEAVAVRLTRKCLSLLKPGGTFLFANFFDDIRDDGFMETFMNWPLILRSEAEMWGIVNRSVDRNQVDSRVEFGANRNILYGIIETR